jgi:hypothetical protein
MVRKTIVACVLVALAVGATTATAAQLITGKDIKNGSITGKDIARKSIGKKKLTAAVQRALAKQGATGPQGPAGAKGDKGDKGDRGDGITRVTSLSSNFDAPSGWVGYASNGCDPGGPKGPIALTDHVKFGAFTNGDMSASLFTRDFNGKKLQDIAYLAYTGKYDQTADAHGGSPYLRVFLEGDNHDVVLSPNTQGRTVRSGDWDKFVVTDAKGLRYDDDAGDGTGEYGLGGTDWDTLVRDHGGETISRLVISAGCGGAYSNGSTAYADNLELDIAGNRALFDFGT